MQNYPLVRSFTRADSVTCAAAEAPAHLPHCGDARARPSRSVTRRPGEHTGCVPTRRSARSRRCRTRRPAASLRPAARAARPAPGGGRRPTRHRPRHSTTCSTPVATGCSSTSRSRTSRPMADSTRPCRSSERTVEELRRRGARWSDRWLDLVVLVGHDRGLPRHRARDPDGVAAHHARRRRRSTGSSLPDTPPSIRGSGRSTRRRSSVPRRRTAVNTWTCNDPDRLVELAAFGVDGVCTDVPDDRARASLSRQPGGAISDGGSGDGREHELHRVGHVGELEPRVEPRASPSTW